MSKLSVGIAGLPNVGKSTLFNALTNAGVNAANYPFATIEPNVGVVPVPDERLQKLATVSQSGEIIPAVVEFYDIAGLVKGANQGEGLGNQFLAHIREVKLIVHVLRVFSSDQIVHVEGRVDALRDLETVNTELILKDLETVEKRLASAAKEARTGDKQKRAELAVLEQVRDVLARGEMVISLGRKLCDQPAVSGLGLLTAKPQLVLVNGTEAEVPGALKDRLAQLGLNYIVLDLGRAVKLDKLIQEAYRTLNLITFFTTGPKETRGWTVRKGALAPQAAGVIHTDFEQKFIRADVIAWDKLVEAGGWQDARSRGLVRTEGKHYVVQDGDVLIIKHS